MNHRCLGPLLLTFAALAPSQDAAAAAPFEVRMLEVPAAAEGRVPQLSATNGIVVLSWVEPAGDDDRLRYAVFDGERFGEARDVVSGSGWFVNWADRPSVVPIRGDLWAAQWLVSRPDSFYAYDVRLALSRDGGRSWSAPVTPHDDGTESEHGFVSLFPDGDGVGLAWLDGRNYASDASDGSQGTMLRAARYAADMEKLDDREIDGLVCDCCQTGAAVAAGAPVIAYRDRTPSETRDITVVRRAEDGWTKGRAVGDDGWTIEGCPVNGPVVAADGSRLAVAWFTGADDAPRVRLATSNDGGATFGAPVDVAAGDTYGHAGVALLSGGRIAVSSLCKVSDTEGRLCLRVVSASGAAGPVRTIGDAPVPPLSVPQLAAAGDTLVAAWIEGGADAPSLRAAVIRTGD